MTKVLTWSGGLGGVVVFVAGVWAIVRGIIRMTDATRANTRAIDRLTGKVEGMGKQMTAVVERIARLEGRRR